MLRGPQNGAMQPGGPSLSGIRGKAPPSWGWALVGGCLLAGVTPTRAQSLGELLEAALARDPAVAAAQAQLRTADERVVQARAAIAPTVQVVGSHMDTRYHEAPTFNLRPFSTRSVTLQITQPLLRTAWLPGVDSAQAQHAQAQGQHDQARAEAAQRLAEAVFEVLKARDTLRFARAQRAATLAQLAQARRSFEVGTVAVTDMRDAEAKADNVAAQIAAGEAELALRQALLTELAGQPAPQLLGRVLPAGALPALGAAQVEDLLAQAQAANPQVRQAEQALAAAEAEVRRVWQGHAPTADLVFNHTLHSETGSATSPFPRRADSTAVGLQFTIPLYAGGATHSKVREAMAQRDRARADLDTARRNVVIGVRQAGAAALAAIAQARALDTALRSQEVALRANRRGYEVGLRVGTEVLEAQTRLFEVRRDRARASYDAWVQLAKLKALAGRLGGADFAEFDQLLVARTDPEPEPEPLRPAAPRRSAP